MHPDLPAYSTQLRYVKKIYDIEVPDITPSFMCPLCFLEFHLNSSKLSKEHVPPHSLGGKRIVITCETCNNQAGSSIESHLKEAIEYFVNRSFPKDLGVPVNIYFGQDAKFSGIMQRKSSQDIELVIKLKNNNPGLVYDFNDKISQGKRDITVNPRTHREVIPNNVIIALLKTAYLQIFWRFGYAPLYDNYFQPIRDQIRFPNTIIYPLELSYIVDESIPTDPGVYLMEFQGLRFFISSFRLVLKGVTKQFNLLIPLLHSKHGIASDAAYLFHHLKRNHNGMAIMAKTISRLERPVLIEEFELTQFLYNEIYYS